MKFIKFYSVAFYKMKNKLPLPSPRVRRGSGSVAMDISGVQ
jgi:hypothetical protein